METVEKPVVAMGWVQGAWINWQSTEEF